jgi:putative MATE family efflux protein
LSAAAPAAPPAYTYRTAAALAAPVVVEQLFRSAVYFADAWMVARLGKAELAAVSTAGVFLWRVTETFACTQHSVGAYVARRWGGHQYAEASAALARGVAIASAIGAAVALACFPLLRSLFAAMQTPPDVMEPALLYAWPVLAVFPLTLVYFNLGTALRATGNTRTPTLVAIAVNSLNVALNYVLIFGSFGAPKLGMMGAGIATGASYAFGAACLLWRLLRGVRPPGHFGEGEGAVLRLARGGLAVPGLARTIFRVAAPAFSEELLVSAGFLAFYSMIARCGTEALAAHTIVVRIEAISFTMGAGCSVAAATMVGQALGRGDHAAALRAFWMNTVIGVVLLGGAGIAFAIWPAALLSLFRGGEDLAAMGTMMMYLVAVQQPVLAITNTFAGGLRGAGDTLSPNIAQLAGQLAIRIGGSWWLGFHLGLGMEGVYLATCVDWTVRAAILGALIAGGRWRRVKL